MSEPDLWKGGAGGKITRKGVLFLLIHGFAVSRTIKYVTSKTSLGEIKMKMKYSLEVTFFAFALAAVLIFWGAMRAIA